MGAIADLRTYIECPINMEVMQDPYMIVPCGHSFEKKAIERWIHDREGTCPLDRGDVERLVPNLPLKSLIERIHQLSETDDDLLPQIEALKKQVLQAREQQAASFKKHRRKQEQRMEKSFQDQTEIGFYLLATCSNEQCQLVGQEVWINRHTGSFSANRECSFTPCSSCGKDFEDINTIAIRAMRYSWKGKKATGENAHRQIDSAECTHVIFANLSQWRYLSIVVES